MSTTSQLVDPFIPQRKTGQRPKQRKLFGQYGSQWINRTKPQPHVTSYNDQVRTRHSTINDPAVSQSLKKDATTLTSIHRMSRARDTINDAAVLKSEKYAQPRIQKKALRQKTTLNNRPSAFRKFAEKLQIPLFTLLAIATGLLSQSLVFGGIMIGIYAFFAYFLRVASRTTFLLSLITFAIVIALYVTDPSVNAAPNFAIYTIMLISIGVVTMGRDSSFAGQ